jgi:hypothetical protein
MSWKPAGVLMKGNLHYWRLPFMMIKLIMFISRERGQLSKVFLKIVFPFEKSNDINLIL